MKTLVPINVLFEPVYGVNLELLNFELCTKNDLNAIRFVSRKEGDNGVAAYVRRVEGIIPNPGNTISVAVSGSVLSSFYQDDEYYSGRDIYYLKPRNKMSVEEMLFYAFCLRANKYKYNYGRGANRTLKDILVPKTVPEEFRRISLSQVEVPNQNPILPEEIELNTEEWKKFRLDDIFDIKKGKRLTREDMDEGETPFVAAIDNHNGWRQFISQPPLHLGHTITVNYNGSVAETFYQPFPFWASDDVNVLYPKFQINVFTALFIATVIEQEKYRFNFGRKWHVDRMNKSEIKLPAKNGKPDFLFMENYIKSLPFSASLEDKDGIEKPNIQKTSKGKGLSDDELIEKYESGKAPMKRFMKGLLKTPPPAAEKAKKG